MAQPVREGRHYTAREGWSPRQKQVFALLARGLTNREIASELGISLDGAKYHVSEVITRLGVDTREEAAEWWRQQHGFRARLRVLARAFVAPDVWRWAGIGGGVAVGTVVVITLGVVLLSGGDGQDGVQPDEVPPPDEVVDSQVGEPVTEIDGVPVEPLDIAGAVELPQGIVVYFQMAFPESDGGPPSLWRAYREESGELRLDELLGNVPAERERIYPVRYSPGFGEILVSVCSLELCGGDFLGHLDGTVTYKVFRSTDGGVSWEADSVVPSDAFLTAVLPDGRVIAMTSISAEGERQFAIFPGGDHLEPPPGAQRAWPSALQDHGLVWIDEDWVHYSDDGQVLWDPGPGGVGQLLAATDGGQHYVSWRPDSALAPELYLGIRDESDQLQRLFEAPGNWHLGPYEPAGPDLLIGYAIYEPQAGQGTGHDIVLIDLDAGQVLPMPGIRPDDPIRAPYFRGLVTGTPLRVQTGDTCLEVRDEPSTTAGVIHCYGDGVLLFERESSEAPDDWLPIRTPGGHDGWAAAEFLAR